MTWGDRNQIIRACGERENERRLCFGKIRRKCVGKGLDHSWFVLLISYIG